MSWHEVKRDDAVFHKFLHEVVALLDGPLPTAETETCDWCSYRTEITGVSDKPAIKASDDSPSIVPSCPLCGDLMKKRSGKFGEFWGCVNFPDCKGTKRT
jgi:hypothetical protein